MNVKKSLDQILKTERKEGLLAYLDNNPDEFEQIINIAMSGDHEYGWKASWLISSYLRKTKDYLRVSKFVKNIIASINGKKDGHQRELLRIILQLRLDEKMEATLFDHCILIWKTPEKSPSVRITAFKAILNIVRKYPELSEEILFLTENHYLDSLSPGIKRSVQKSIAQLKDNRS